MAPIKRSRRAIEADEEEEASQSNSFVSDKSLQTPKRARVSFDANHNPNPAHDTSSSDNDDDDDDDEVSDNYGRPDSPPQTQYELMRDAGFKHLQHTDKDDLQATQKLLRRSRSMNVGDNAVAESGIIQSITCYNFMCHERLHVDLGPLINFVVGENGSGKSAVLTALTLCLGGKASDTNRGGSLKSFVREGQDHGSVVVTIKNAGSDAYQPDIYGPTIVVERHFSRAGASGFKIKTDIGKIVSTKKQEVDEISEWYALQIGNPLTVLSQDNARQFLNSASPAQKYKYFVSGVQLEQLDNDYKMSQDTLDKTLILRDDLDEKIGQAKKVMKDAQILAETAQKNESLREKARHHRNQLVWSQVVEQERALELRIADIANREQRIDINQQDCAKMADALLEIEQKLQRVKDARESLNEEQGEFEERVSAAKAVYENAKKELTELMREERDAQSRLKTARSDIQACQEKIQQEEKRVTESTGTARAEKEAELAEASGREKNLNEQIDQCNMDVPKLQRQVVDAEEALKIHQQTKKAKRDDILMAERGVQELEKSNGSPLDGFDADIRSVARAMERDDSFEQKPLGPIGAHIKLLKPEWSGVLEKTFGEALNAFVVRSKRDQSRLSELMRRTGVRKSPPIYIAGFQGRINTENQEPHHEFDTILRVLEFDHELIRSQLVINNQIEKVILVPERLEAERIMLDNNGPPRNVLACICFHDGKGKRGQGLRMTNRAGNISSSPIKPTGQRPRMQSDSGRQLALQKENLRQLGLEMRDVNSEERQAQQQLQRCKSELEAHRKSIKALENDLRRTQAEVERVSMELDDFEGADDRLVTLRAELETKRSEEEQLGSQYGNMRLTKRDLNTKTEDAKRKLNAERREGEDFQARVTKADEKIQSHESMRRIAVSKKNETYEKHDIEVSELRRAHAKRDEKAREVEDFARQAEQVAPDRVYIAEGETYQSIEKKYQKIGEQLAQREARLGASDQQIYDRATEARTRYDDIMKQTRDVDETISSLKRAIENRLDLWRKFQRQISARIRIQFNYLLSERGFRGKINLDHKARKVLIQIEPDETRKSSSGRNTKTLSGGEKSFSSICMLLSVWEAIGSPIRCLDEFDVFMDNVNRAISTNMLVDAARRSVSRQYILITPNAIEGRARLDKDVKIIRLTDPRQRTLI